ncbi:hypothetical protein [Candidatus Rhabdochlamydia sp. T3358]|uniref:hypothetical protein n=1 Tax=Candidatus Rhabdochlamydia sp. T3358 TaxID=2099795 RepID=UPI0010BA60C3|nr:hypothetical protein [Candidatus Rhabdochlamydia sp. T3358]VHO03345.1 hypothetical protein RHT_00863 [Candidatus Rhabdochlamydia sp. T3358]
MATPVGSGNSSIFFMSSAPSTRPQLSAEEEQYVQELVSMPLDSILDNESGEEKCKKLGQEIFDRAKAAPDADSYKPQC